MLHIFIWDSSKYNNEVNNSIQICTPVAITTRRIDKTVQLCTACTYILGQISDNDFCDF